VLLVGFMGSGKSTVGPLLAEALSWRFVDFDARIEAQDGRPIRRIFAEDGEPWFRALEERVARALLAEDEVVLGSGGGWAAVPGRLASLPSSTLSVWLRVSPEVAVARAGAGGDRPLLAGPDRLSAARRLIESRTPAYAQATVEVDTDGRTPVDVSRTILALLERRRSDSAVGT
jgi:shikimate kinase